MSSLFIAHFVQTLGEVFIAYTVLRVHHGMMTERQIDKKVLSEMKTEQIVGAIGLLLIIVGFLMRWLI